MIQKTIIAFILFFTITACVKNPPAIENTNLGKIEKNKHKPEKSKPQNVLNKISGIKDTSHYQNAYENLLTRIKNDKKQLLTGVQNNTISMDSVSNYFLEIMRDSIFQYWYGTTWEFNGHTNDPREGEIACGYFISTPLKHLGLNVNRYKLAQQGATNIMKSVCKGKDFFRTTSKEKLINYLNEQKPDGLYVIGLSFHVGYILREKGNNYFVHSNYKYPIAVCKEKVETSLALDSSNDYILGELSMNHAFLKQWLSGERLVIIQ